VLVLCLLLLSAQAPASEPGTPPVYERRELTIPMRDGVKLFAVALVPRQSATPLPILFIRTPFSAANGFRNDQVPPAYRELAEDGYIFVLQDIRGRFQSGGEFVSLRAQQDPRSPKGINESTDSWDSVDWLVKHLTPNNGRVGVLGMSYPGWLAALAGLNPHPAVKAISPQAPMGDAWMGDDFFHQGAFRQTQGAVYSGVIEADPKGFSEFVSQGDDQYSFYLQFPTLDSLARATGVSTLPMWRSAVEHPVYDDYWQRRALSNVFSRATVPTLFVGGWWDAEDLLGPQLMYRTIERHDRAGINRLVLGPWTHGSWMRPGGDSVGAIPLGSRTNDHFRAQIQRPWLAYYLHDRGAAPVPEVWAFETGANAWRTFDQWPPRQVQSRKLYLRADGLLSFDPPGKAPSTEFASFQSDPANPVPFAPRPITDDGWRTWLLNDQRFLRDRDDVLTWRSAPLTEDLTIAGDVIARLVASTTGTDADWVVKLIDQYPDSVPEAPALGGFQLIVNAEILRGRYWRGFTRATAIPANRPTAFTVDLRQQLYRFRKGHRLMVQVQSSWFPLYDRNPQSFVPNIFRAPASAYRAREHRIWHSFNQPSFLALPVLSPSER
jgi:putative CocE/NonD family hydrolase